MLVIFYGCRRFVDRLDGFRSFEVDLDSCSLVLTLVSSFSLRNLFE